MTRWVLPAGPGVRVDTAIEPGDRVPPEYDNLIAKLMVHAGDRGAAIVRLRRALDELEVGGLQTTLPFHRFVVDEPDFVAGRLSTGYVGEHWDGTAAFARAARAAQLAAALDALTAASPTAAGPGPAPSVGEGSSGPADASSTARSSAWRRAGRLAGSARWPG